MRFLDNGNKNLIKNGIDAQLNQVMRLKELERNLFKNQNYRIKNNQQKILNSLGRLKNYTLISYELGNDSERRIAQKVKSGVSFDASFNRFSSSTHSTFGKSSNILHYVRNGACVGAFGSYALGDFQTKYKSKYLNANASASVLKIKGNVDAEFELFKNKKLDPRLILAASASATLASTEAKIILGNDKINASVQAIGSLGVAHGEVKAVISKSEISGKVDVGVALARGEAQGAIEFFGIKISASGSGEIGSAGFSAEYSSKKGEFSFGGKLSMIAGLGFKIKVEY